MLKGAIETLMSSGYVEGWAYNANAPLTPLAIIIADNQGHEIAAGLAHRYRIELANVGHGAGWCAFRLRTHIAVSRLKTQRIKLLDRCSGRIIASRSDTPLVKDSEAPITELAQVFAQDPTMSQALDQLHACDGQFKNYIDKRGVDSFIRAAYVYVLGRPADRTGLDSYGQQLRKKLLRPHELLLTLANSEEFRMRGATIAAPWSDAFLLR